VNGTTNYYRVLCSVVRNSVDKLCDFKVRDEENELQDWWRHQDQDDEWIGEQCGYE